MSTPNEVYRKDLVSAMLVTELPECAQTFLLQDNWKTEWERGVQVPAKLKQKKAQVIELDHVPQPPIEVPRHRPRYCLDNLDVAWLDLANQHRTAAALPRLTEDDLEMIIDDFETQANSTISQRCNNKTAKSLEDNSVCDVCRSPHGEDGNELVFCDGCDICVHQHCYGIMNLDDQKWFCRPCQENLKPKCYLCAQHGGAMTKAIGWEKLMCESVPWVHIQCALWIPEVTMTKPDRMSDPDLSQIPDSRRSLKCYVCQNPVGCVQCNVKKCFKSYHVTCGVRNGQSVRIEHKGGQVNLISNCDKHSEQKTDEVRKRRTSIDQQIDEERRVLEENFFTLVSLEHAQKRLAQYSMDTLDWVFEYWRLRRRSNNNQQLIIENDGEPEAATAEQRYRRITQLRTDLEKSRNLLCLIMKRERVKRQILRCDREIKLKEMKFLGSKVQLSEWTKSELQCDLDDSGNVKTEADDAAQFLEDLDLETTTEVTTKTPPPSTTNNISKPPPPINKPPQPKFNQLIGQQKKIKINDDKAAKKHENETSNKKTDQIKSENLDQNQKPNCVENQQPAPPPPPESEKPVIKPQPVKPLVPSPRITVSKTGKNPVGRPPLGTPVRPANPSTQNPPTQTPTNVTEVKVGNRKMKLVQNFHTTRPFRGQQGSITRLNGPMKINTPRPPNGPQPGHFEGKTVIGTKTVGGQQQQITMDNAALQRTFRNNPNAASTNQAVRITNPPANLVVTSKMVGGKEVQLVTPNIGPKNKGTIRFVRPGPVGTGTGPKATVTISNSLAKSNFRPPGPTSSNQPVSGPFPKIFNSANVIRPPSVVPPPPAHQPNQQQMMHQTQQRLPVNVRTAVGGANEKNLPKPIGGGNAKSAHTGKAGGIIKLGALVKPPKDQPVKEAEKDEEDVSTRQLAEKFLNSGSSRKINKKLTDLIKPTINKATERLLDKAKTDTPTEKPTPKPEEKKKNKGLSFGSSLFAKKNVKENPPMDNRKTAFLNRMLASISKTSQKKKPQNQKKSKFSPFVSKKATSNVENQPKKMDQSETL